jgi:hypothetical protein
MALTVYTPGANHVDRARAIDVFGLLSESSAMSVDESFVFTTSSFVSTQECEEEDMRYPPRWLDYPRFGPLAAAIVSKMRPALLLI